MVEVKKICVLGAGIMGSGIAQVAAQAGYQVAMVDTDQKFLDNGFSLIRKSLDIMQSKGKISEDQLTEILKRINGILQSETD